MQRAAETIPSHANRQADPQSSCPVRSSPSAFVTRTSTPNPQSQSFSRSYGSILPTSLIYIVLSTRGYTPWRPDAVMSTTWGANKSRPRIFMDRCERTGRDKSCRALPPISPYRRLNRSRAVCALKRKENSSRGSPRRLRVCLRCRTVSTSRFGNINPIPFR